MVTFPRVLVRIWGLNLIFPNSYFLFLSIKHKQYITGLTGKKMSLWSQWEERFIKWHIVWSLELALLVCWVHYGSQILLIIPPVPQVLPVSSITPLSDVFPPKLGGPFLFFYTLLLNITTLLIFFRCSSLSLLYLQNSFIWYQRLFRTSPLHNASHPTNWVSDISLHNRRFQTSLPSHVIMSPSFFALDILLVHLNSLNGMFALLPLTGFFQCSFAKKNPVLALVIAIEPCIIIISDESSVFKAEVLSC